MRVNEIYEEIKRSLDYFGLKFHEMHLVEGSMYQGKIVLKYGNREVTIYEEPQA